MTAEREAAFSARGRYRSDVCVAVISDLSKDARVWREVRSLARRGYSITLIGCAYDESEVRCRKEGRIHIVEVPLGSRQGRVSIMARARALLRVFREVLRVRACVYHTHNIHPALATYLASHLCGARLVYDAHELYGQAPEASPLRRRMSATSAYLIERIMVRRSDAVITTNPARADELRRRHGRDGIAVLANVPDRIETIVPLDPGYPKDRSILLYQGGIYAYGRSFRETIRALRYLEDVDFVVLGFGRDDDLTLIRRWAAAESVEERVHLLGPRPFDQLVRTAAAATVGLVPIKPLTLNELLGDTNKLHEYLMAGLPVVASDLPEIRRVVREGSPPVGECFDPDDPESIAAAVRRVLQDRREYQARSREARNLALSRYNWQAQQHVLDDVYDRLRVPLPVAAEQALDPQSNGRSDT